MLSIAIGLIDNDFKVVTKPSQDEHERVVHEPADALVGLRHARRMPTVAGWKKSSSDFMIHLSLFACPTCPSCLAKA